MCALLAGVIVLSLCVTAGSQFYFEKTIAAPASDDDALVVDNSDLRASSIRCMKPDRHALDAAGFA